MRLLLAEDEADLSRVLQAALKLQGYEVDAVYDGEAAVTLARQNAYDCMVFDIMMPKLDGLGALRQIRAKGLVTPVLLLTAKLYAEGSVFALGLPFVLGLGMGAPWPFAGAGLKVLPKPGAWMTWVNRLFGVLVFCFAAWYGSLAWTGFRGKSAADGAAATAATAEPAAAKTAAAKTAGVIRVASPKELNLDGLKRPILVDCWATWCKNCTAMERKTLKDPQVVEALKGFTVIRLQAEDIDELLALPDFANIHGLPAFVIFE